MFRKLTLGASLAAMMVFVPSAGLAAGSRPAQASATTVNATETNNGSTYVFQPDSITIKVGDKVTFKNTGQVPHTATDDDNSFDSSNLAAGDSYTTPAFTTAGTFTYSCIYHKTLGMVGTIIVTGASTGGGGTTTTASPAASSAASPDASPAASPSPPSSGLPAPVAAQPPPPSQKYFPKIAGILMVVALIAIGLGYLRMKRTMADKG